MKTSNSDSKPRFDIGKHSRLAGEALKKQPELLAKIKELEGAIDKNKALIAQLRNEGAEFMKKALTEKGRADLLKTDLEKEQAKGVFSKLFGG